MQKRTFKEIWNQARISGKNEWKSGEKILKGDCK